MNDLKEIKNATVSYWLHSSFVKEIVKTWASREMNCALLMTFKDF